jgi:solute carrier family 25 aspartate/glutamate transporter 12/13
VPTPLVDFAIGGIAGGAGAFAAYPLDYITAQMQKEQSQYKDGLECLVETCNEGGPLFLYRGAGVQVLGIAPEKAIKLNVNDLMKHLLTSCSGGTLTLGGEVMSGALAGLCQVIATSPLETIKVALQTSDKTLAEVMEEVGGVGGLFRGAEACMARDIVFTALLFPMYSHLRMVMPGTLTMQ